MAIFSTLRGKRGGRRESIFGGSTEDGSIEKKARSPSTPYNRDATDVLGESPSFTRHRTPSESTSLKNRKSATSMLRLFGSSKRSASGHDGPGKAKGSSTKSEAGQVRASEAEPRLDKLASSTSLSQNGAAEPVSSGPRPSDLFAGKGVNWDEVKLSGPAIAPTDNKRNDELQTFLKARRQWIPTFKTDENAEGEADKAPAKLEEVSFGGAPPAPAGLMTLRDLEASHNRKQKLLSDLPTPSLTNEPIAGITPSSSAAGPSSVIGGVAKPSLISRPSQSSSIRTGVEPARNQSFRQSSFVGGTGLSLSRTTSGGPASPARKPAPAVGSTLPPISANGNGNGNATHSTSSSKPGAVVPVSAPAANRNGPGPAPTSAATVSAPPRKSSVALPTGEPVAAPATQGAALIRPSTDSSTAGFQTPEARSDAAHVESGPAGDETPKVG